MLRSLIAVLVSVLVGLTAAKFLEGGLAALTGVEGILSREEELPAAYQVILVFAWFVGALIAAAIAVLMGRKWAPLGWVASVTILFNAIMTITAASVSWWMWLTAPVVTLIAGAIAIRVLNAQNTPFEKSPSPRFLE